ncbi:MAG TPA: mandelate racemase/muconate lactonizing enzyme family protein [Gaiellaceae bacterium]|nr:mandelate racemase/muconate lactonizing enzyme family protein [Gaiellaceae bacterium]
MRIARVDAVPVAVPLLQEFHWAAGSQHGANLVLFRVETDDGVAGWGESICEAPGAVAEVGRLIARQLQGRPVGDVEAILHAVWTEGRWKTTPQLTQFVVAGLESACWDALGHTLGTPTRTFFGGAVRDELDYFGFLQGDDAQTLAAHARQLADHEVVYLKVGRPRDDDAIVAAVREAIGPGKRLRIDPNEAWDAATAVERIRRLELHDLDWVEQPTPHWDVAGLAHVRSKVSTRIAADQAVYTTQQLRQVLEAGAADVIVQGPHDAGGLLRFRQQAAICAAWGLNVNLHAFMQSELSFLAHAQVAATIPNLTDGNQAMHQLLAERLTRDVDVSLPGGRFRLPDGPGHGFRVDEDAVGRAHERFLRDGAYGTVESVPR